MNCMMLVLLLHIYVPSASKIHTAETSLEYEFCSHTKRAKRIIPIFLIDIQIWQIMKRKLLKSCCLSVIMITQWYMCSHLYCEHRSEMNDDVFSRYSGGEEDEKRRQRKRDKPKNNTTMSPNDTSRHLGWTKRHIAQKVKCPNRAQNRKMEFSLYIFHLRDVAAKTKWKYHWTIISHGTRNYIAEWVLCFHCYFGQLSGERRNRWNDKWKSHFKGMESFFSSSSFFLLIRSKFLFLFRITTAYLWDVEILHSSICTLSVFVAFLTLQTKIEMCCPEVTCNAYHFQLKHM